MSPDSPLNPYDVRQKLSELDHRIEATREDLIDQIKSVTAQSQWVFAGSLTLCAFFLGAFSYIFIHFAFDPINAHLESIDKTIANLVEARGAIRGNGR